ncbi:MAG: class I SAM-dependent methyltransferase [Acidobacteriota bacterium]
MSEPTDRDPSHLDANRRLWDHWTDLHHGAKFYDVDGFLRGESTLRPIEVEEVGDVAGRSLLHLQCHFGLDTLSWARKGAKVTGIDLSDRAVDAARQLAAETELDARFLSSDLYHLDEALGDEQFDIVFTSYGVLCWLHDLHGWGQRVARRLRPGGRFHIVEFHPVLEAFSEDGRPFDHPYFGGGPPIETRETESYADKWDSAAEPKDMKSYVWTHGLGEIVGALLDAGLVLDHLREHAESPYDCYPFTQEIAPGRSVVPGYEGKIPMLFSLQAHKG